MKTLLGNIGVTQEQKNLILEHPYLRSSENGFKFNFSRPEATIDPFEGMESTGREYYEMTVELDAMGWICIGEIFEKTKTTM